MRQEFPNVLIFCGSGQNVGKTSLIRSVIETICKKHEVAAIKICPHYHTSPDDKGIVWQEEGFKILLEEGISQKDSALFFKAGARPVYYIETKDQTAEKAFYKTLEMIGSDKLIICESGYLGTIIRPGFLIYVEAPENNNALLKKTSVKGFADLILKIGKNELDDYKKEISSRVAVNDGKWILK